MINLLSTSLSTIKCWPFNMLIMLLETDDHMVICILLTILALLIIAGISTQLTGHYKWSLTDTQFRSQLHGGGCRSTALWQYHDLQKFQVKGQAFSGHEQFTFVSHLSKDEFHYIDRCESEITTVFPVQRLQNLTRTQVFDILVKHGVCVKKQDSLATLIQSLKSHGYCTTCSDHYTVFRHMHSHQQPTTSSERMAAFRSRHSGNKGNSTTEMATPCSHLHLPLNNSCKQ